MEAAGGWVEDQRVCDILAVSRAFGDADFKGPGRQKLLAKGVECVPATTAAAHACAPSRLCLPQHIARHQSWVGMGQLHRLADSRLPLLWGAGKVRVSSEQLACRHTGDAVLLLQVCVLGPDIR